MEDDDALPLAGTTVLELGNVVSAPFASLLLADLGADVIKIERPEIGDIVRNTGDSGQAIINAYNRNKRSLSLDLKSTDGKDVYYELASDADVVIENFGAGVADRLEIGYENLREVNPGLIYLSIKGFYEGPYGDRPGMDMVAEAMSGMVAMTGRPGDGPVRVGTSITDLGTAMYGTIGVLLALRERDQTGEGQRVDAALFESAVQWMGYWMTYADMVGQDHPALGSSHPSFSLYDVFETNEPETQVFVGVTSERHWPAFCRAVDRTDLLADERFDTIASRLANTDELVAEVKAELRDWNRDELVDVLLAENVPTAPVSNPSELLTDEHLETTGLLARFDGRHGDETKRLRTALTPIRGSNITTEQRRDPPALGEHSREILSAAGYDEETIVDLLERGVVDEP